MSAPAFPQRIRPGLSRVRRALDLLGHPDESFASVVVAGTNGKGSVSALMESALRQAGYRTGLYTSPHLVNIRERVTLSGRLVSPSLWRTVTERVADLCRSSRLVLTAFEAQTLAAFLVFEKTRVEIAVLEVGLGGRWDAVNAVAAPELSVITSIGLDHTDWLGPTVNHIYREKRGVARSGTLLVQNIPARLRGESARWAAAQGVPMWTFGREIRLTGVRRVSPARGQRITVTVPDGKRMSVRIPFWGDHQARNGALAVAGLVQLRRRGWSVSDRAIQEGLGHARWPGRFHVVRRSPPVVLDGAHNPAAARVLTQSWACAPWRRKKATLIFSCLKDKDMAGLVRALRPIARRVVVVPIRSDRARSTEDMRRAWKRACPVLTVNSFSQAWRCAREEKGSPVLVAGSLYLVGDALRFFKNPTGRV